MDATAKRVAQPSRCGKRVSHSDPPDAHRYHTIIKSTASHYLSKHRKMRSFTLDKISSIELYYILAGTRSSAGLCFALIAPEGSVNSPEGPLTAQREC